MKKLLDTDTCISILRGDSAVVERASLNVPDDLAYSSVTRYELYHGAARCPEPRREAEAAKVKRFLGVLHEVPFDSEAADRAAEIRAGLEAKGTPIGPMDLLIAATALANDMTLITGNLREFKRVETLTVESWM